MASSTKEQVQVRLEVINKGDSGESYAARYIALEAPSYQVRIGRGSRSGGKDLYPADNNAWFDSRVMSREHAVLKANIDTKTITIEDVGSMHGTYVDDVKLAKFVSKVVHDGSEIVFGAEVSRGPDTFPALEMEVFYSFDGEFVTSGRREYHSERASRLSRNSFSVPDYDSEEEEYISETEVKVVPRHAAAIPESEVSNDSFVSDDEMPWNRSHCNTFQAAQKASQELSEQTKAGPADVIMWSKGDLDPRTFENTTTINKEDASQLLKKSEDSPNLTDEQSESDYGDDISADLFDEDFDTDEYQRPLQQPDNSSFTSQSPVLTSLPSKIELAEHQSTVNETTKPCMATPSIPAASIPRAPSPSDAAMPKAKTAPSEREWQFHRPEVTSEAKPFSQYQYASTQPVNSLDPSFARSYGYTSSQEIHSVQDTYPQPYYNPVSIQPYPYFDGPALDFGWGTSLKTLEPEPAPASAPANSFITIKTTPRVTIKDLVDETQTVECSFQKRRGTPYAKGGTNVQRSCFSGIKRKADQISSEASQSAPAVDLLTPAEALSKAFHAQHQPDAQIVKPLAPTTNSQSQTDLWEPMVVTKSVIPGVLSNIGPRKTDDERPKKKTRGSFYTDAAIAAGYIAIGAVGAVAALVALPPDFFV